ncbi:outer membrane protein assembly factor BamA [Desulfonema ishimotonii]|uniref:Outer membrane protein assembly factor BamA n=1 Tax=Desulfonema ishimotonii TaxID=45657 RepID=A0A401FSV9_9BACT|nr:outer membrane protein assembly factor BamA [Desulfonema ishimotonii]GBC60057.1 outer membrane protein assembly factor BamA [Desulfonema ishimotonii]
MFRRSVVKEWFIIVLLCCLSGTVHAQDAVRVTVLPFEINAIEGRDYLQEKLPAVIKTFLDEEGATVVDPQIPRGTPWAAVTRKTGGIRRFGIDRGADYVIWGSLTRVGQKISIDAKMISSMGTERPSVFFTEGRGIEDLSTTVRELVREFSLKLFKKERVAKVGIKGNRRIESDAIREVIKTGPGDVFLAKSLSGDLKAVYKMGYFDDIRIDAEESPDGKIITFNVREKPTIRRIRITGNRIYEDDEVKENLNLKTGSILNIYDIQSNIRRIESLYKDKNYHNVRVAYNTEPLENNQADLEFVIEEGEKVRIKSISFIGNQAFSNEDLKDLIKSSEKGIWSWLTSSGELNREDLNQDAARLTAFYHNNGYIEAKVGEPEIDYEGNWIFISMKIDEGPRYRIGNVAVAGDLIMPEKELLGRLKITREEYYSREIVRSDTLKLTDLYSDEGYAYADIAPKIDRQANRLVVDLTYTVKKGKQVYFEKIMISGNTKTRDKVIRRQLRVYEQGLYSGQRLKRGVRNLHRLDYFEDIKVNTVPGSADDQMVLKIDVSEKPTGTFSFGGGYSSEDNLFAMASISQRNLFGRGQTLQLKAELGGSTTRFTTSFTEPWLFDIPLSAGFDLYNWEREYDTYDRDSVGGAIRFGYPVIDYTRAYLTYRYDISDIRNVTDDASDEVQDLEGENTTSSVTGMLKYDSRDKAFNPTEGGSHNISIEYAGLGGDIAFTKYTGEAGQYFPLFWGTVGFVHAKGGYVRENSGGKLPDYEKFYLGGINSLRGFDWREISLRDEDDAEIGGYKFVQFNVEYIVPLIKEAGLVGVLFFDTGNVFDKSEDVRWDDLRESAGFGFRWYSPMGPIRIEYGYILDRKDNEESGRWEFAMGSAF